MHLSELGEFAKILLFIIGGIVFVAGGMITSYILSPSKPNPLKQSPYECGEDPVGNARIQINIRFYIVALIFLIFDVEILFLFPWALVYADPEIIASAPSWGWFALLELMVFVGVLLIGLAYLWTRGYLDWIRSEPIREKTSNPVPAKLYDIFNQKVESA